MSDNLKYDYIVIGSGFGGSVSALRLAEKGYKVLVLEQGKWLGADDFPGSNWNLKRWLWLPLLRFFGLFKVTMFRHVSILSGVGVGGGSLVYANTLPVPKKEFFTSGSWAGLENWEEDLAPWYKKALEMLGAEPNPRLEHGDKLLRELASEIGMQQHYAPTNVGVYFGESEVDAPDPYFGGKGPDRTGCRFCGGCMLGCKYNSKNTLDKNYLHLAQQDGAKILAESVVTGVKPLDGADGSEGYEVKWQSSTAIFKKNKQKATSRGVIFSGGVLGTVKLLLNLKQSTLPRLSDTVGTQIRTNSESLVGVTSYDRDDTRFSDGIAIGSILHTDEHSHVEPVRYPDGSGFWRLFMAPLVSGGGFFTRLAKVLYDLVRHPILNLRVFFVDDWAKRTQVLLYMRSTDGTLRFRRSIFGMSSGLDTGEPPSAFIPEARDVAERYARLANGKPMVLLHETLFGIPTTAHILGGACIGSSTKEGVVDSANRVFGYQNMMVCDGSMISANPGVNPSLSITAISERAMSLVPAKADA